MDSIACVTSDSIYSNYRTIRILFYEFFVTIMLNYDLYAKYDYFKNKTTNIGLK